MLVETFHQQRKDFMQALSRILLIASDPARRLELVGTLMSSACLPLCARSAMEAISFLRSGLVADVIVLDLLGRTLDCTLLARDRHVDQAKLPIICVTSQAVGTAFVRPDWTVTGIDELVRVIQSRLATT
jgi:DNA-binding NtrC family response regulator